MTKAELLEKDIEKSVELFKRVVRLNQRAIATQSIIKYDFGFSCGSNGVSFTIYARSADGEYTQLNDGRSHYLGETYGKSLEDIEKEIAKEEKLYDAL